LAEDYSGMTVNERLFVAGLADAYDEAVATGDLGLMNRVLAQVNLRRDASGMHHEVRTDVKD
jgi:hypothetical protein